jgi:hypothetical protein
VVLLDSDEIRVTSKHIPVDPKWPDSAQTTKLAAVKIDRGQYVLTGAWSQESNATGYKGPRTEPGLTYRFWLVSKNVMWFKNGNSPYWNKLRRS